MKKICFLLGAFLCFSVPAFAKLGVQVTVTVVEDDKRGVILRTDFERRLNETNRYFVTKEDANTSLFLTVNCVPRRNLPNVKWDLVCQSFILYYPFPNMKLHEIVENYAGIVIAAPDEDYIAKQVIEAMAKQTTDEKLDDLKKQLTEEITDFIRAHPEFVELAKKPKN